MCKNERKKHMATTTFDKRIVLSRQAAQVLAKELSDNTETKRPNIADKLAESERKWNQLLSRCEK